MHLYPSVPKSNGGNETAQYRLRASTQTLTDLQVICRDFFNFLVQRKYSKPTAAHYHGTLVLRLSREANLCVMGIRYLTSGASESDARDRYREKKIRCLYDINLWKPTFA
jgi:hypothetical protein